MWRLRVIDSFFFPLLSLPMSSAAGRGWGAWLVLDLPVNQIHQESVAGEIKITQQWGGGRNTHTQKRARVSQIHATPIWSCHTVAVSKSRRCAWDAEYASAQLPVRATKRVSVESEPLFISPPTSEGFVETREEKRDARTPCVFEASSQSTAHSRRTSWECCECCTLVLLQTAGADG